MDNRVVLEIIREVKKAVIGKDEHILKVMTAILAGGHILLEDIPGVGKTTMAVAFSKAMGISHNRIQFTPDVMPADIVGFSMYNKNTGTFEIKPGPIVCNLFLADEINRTSPKTQSALLEVMEEGAVTIDGRTMQMPQPFIVIATQNPVGSAGTQLLPESQMDRFMVCLSMGYPDMQDELEIVKGKFIQKEKKEVQAVIEADKLMQLREEVNEVFVKDSVYEYAGRLITKTRENSFVELGVSPRGTIALIRMAKAFAYINGRDYVIPEDVNAVFADVARHRLVLAARARVSQVTPEQIVEEILKSTQQPSVKDR